MNDRALCFALGANCLFASTAAIMYIVKLYACGKVRYIICHVDNLSTDQRIINRFKPENTVFKKTAIEDRELSCLAVSLR